MANDGQIVFEVTADGKHAIADIKEITRAIQQETGKWDTAAKQSTDNINKSFSGMLKGLVAGLSAAKIGQMLLNIGKDAIEAASDLQEVQNVVDVTFGENANQIEKWAKNAGTQFGLTETQAKRFSSTMGAMLKSSGLAGDQIVDVSTDLAGLAADMASFYNLDFDTAFQKIRSGISGQTMPLKELGIDMSVATLNAFALQQGLTKTFDQMSQGEQTMLRYQYLMQATADAQGDFSRTSDGYANSMRKLQTNLETLKTTLGKSFIDLVAGATGALNGLIESLMPDESKKTVLDDFAEIDANTQRKIEEIRKTADEAKELIDVLDTMGGNRVDKVGSKVQQLATDLSSISFEEGKAGAVSEFISVLANNVDTIADIQGTDADGAKEWLDGIAESANKLNPEDAEGWKTLADTIKEGLPGLENTDFGASFFAALGSGAGDAEKQVSVMEWALTALGDKTNKTAEEQKLWLETCKALVHTIPGLSSIINVETGEVKGGTDAIREYVKAWEEGKTKLALLGALEQKEAALSSRFADLPELQLDMALAQRRAKKAYEQLQGIYDKYGLKLGFNKDGSVYRDFSRVYGLTQEDKDYLNRETDYFEQLQKEAREATEAYQLQADALEEAKKALQEYRATIDEACDSAGNAAKEFAEWSDKAKENAQTLVNAVRDTTKELADYVQGVRDATLANIDSTVKGFDKIETSSSKMKDLTDRMSKMTTGSDEWEKLNKELQSLKGNAYSAQNISANLEQQAQYMQDYLDFLNKARERGISYEVLAQLSDGSVESYDVLKALADASPEEAKRINDNYQKVIDKKKEMTDQLSDQQLTVDKTYESLAAKAKAAVDALDLEGEAADNTGKTVMGMAKGIQDHVPEVENAVDQIEAQLNRLNNWGINIDLGGFGSISFTGNSGQKVTSSGGGTVASNMMGLPYVPFDNYYTRLHEGERVLTAQENQIWNSLLNGGVYGFDLESLGGVMRDNIHAGGNVYLDGKVVGNVISDRQGRSYKSLQRSGWQA